MGLEKQINIYEYSSSRNYLVDVFRLKKQKNNSYSLRSWAKKLGFKNNAQLSMFFQGKRDLTLNKIPYFIADLDLSSKEALYFEGLVELDRAKNNFQRQMIYSRLNEIIGLKEVKFKELESFQILKNPIYAFVLEMCELSGVEPSAAGIAKNMRKELLGLYDVSQILETLDAAGLIVRKGDKYKKTNINLQNIPDLESKAVQSFHSRCCDIARESLDQIDLVEREFNTFIFNIRSQDLPKLRQQVRKAIKEIMVQFEAPPDHGDCTYMLQGNLVPITKGVGDEKKSI